MYLRETAAYGAMRRQAASILRHGGEDPGLAAHLQRAARRVALLTEEIAGTVSEPPRGVLMLFRSLGAVVGIVTALGGGRRTLRAIGDGARGLAGRYGRHLSSELPADLRFLLACNYRDVLLLGRWVEGRLDETRPPRRWRWRGRPRVAQPSARDTRHRRAAGTREDRDGAPNAFFSDRPPSSPP